MLGHETAYAKMTLTGAATGSGPSAPDHSSLRDAIESAAVLGKRLDEFDETLAAIAERAEKLAALLGGPYPVESRSGATDGGRESRSPRSSVDAINIVVTDLFDKVLALGSAQRRVVRALDVIERAIG